MPAATCSAASSTSSPASSSASVGWFAGSRERDGTVWCEHPTAQELGDERAVARLAGHTSLKGQASIGRVGLSCRLSKLVEDDARDDANACRGEVAYERERRLFVLHDDGPVQRTAEGSVDRRGVCGADREQLAEKAIDARGERAALFVSKLRYGGRLSVLAAAVVRSTWLCRSASFACSASSAVALLAA